MAHRVAAVTAHERDLGAGNLPVGAIDALQLARAFHDLQHSLHVRLRQLAT